MRLAFAADMHGNLPLYQALFDLALAADAQAVIIGGDLCPHEYQLSRALRTQRAFLSDGVRPLLVWLRAERPALTILLIPGNDDWAEAALPELAAFEQAGLAISLHGRVLQLGPNLWAAGYACVPPTPFSIKDFERPDAGAQRSVSFERAYASAHGAIAPLSVAEFDQRPSIADGLAALTQQSDPRRTIYVCHTPPAATPLDQMRGDRHVGSPALRQMIEQQQPLLTLHGHIHEAPALSGQYACQIGASWCINPGRDVARLHAVVLETDAIAGSLNHTVYGAWAVQPGLRSVAKHA